MTCPAIGVTDSMIDAALEAANGAIVDTRRHWTDGDRQAVRAMLEAVCVMRSESGLRGEPVAWLKTKGELRRVDLFPELDTWMKHDGGWTITPLYAAFKNAAPQASPSVAPTVHVGPAASAPVTEKPLTDEERIAGEHAYNPGLWRK